MQGRGGHATQAMDALLSAVVGDLISRLVSFLIRKYQEPNANTTAVRLQRALLRARVVVEEAEGRQIANRAMLHQLIQLRRQLCQAAYTLDAFRWSSHTIVSRSRSRTRLPQSRDCSDALSMFVESLESTLNDMREFVVLLGSCPCVTKQPYSTYLFMESCMFGRQLEKQEIMSFLLKPSQDVDVLPIIGPHEVGKRTLVEHCLDERVQQHFAKIHRLSSSDLDLHSHQSFLFDYTARSLMVIDILDGDADAEESCRRFYSVARRRAHGESKIIVISRTEAHSSLGTVPPLRLRALSREELWYFFKSLAFGPVDPDEHPDLVRIAMMMFASAWRTPLSLFTSVSISAASLRTDVSVRSWRRLLTVLSEGTHLQLGAAGDGWKEVKDGPYYLCRPVKDAPGVSCLFSNHHKLTRVERTELPKVTLPEMLAGASSPPSGKTRFDVLVWQSRIPPHGAYVATCDMKKARQVVAREKQGRKRQRSYQRHEDHQ